MIISRRFRAGRIETTDPTAFALRSFLSPYGDRVALVHEQGRPAESGRRRPVKRRGPLTDPL